jgi:alkylation response protein AidB-like acyl-CoA dehydrogenase
MEFRLSDDQVLFVETLRRFLSARAPVRHVLAVIENGGFDEALWPSLCEIGIGSVMVPEEYGGLGGSVLDVVVAVEALAEVCIPIPYLGALVLAPAAITMSGDPSRAADTLAAIASGKVRLAVAGIDPAQTASLEFADNTLSGSVGDVFESAGATHLLCIMSDGAMVGIDRAGAGVTVDPVPSLDGTRPIANWRLDGCVPVFSLTPGDPDAIRARLIDLGRVVLAADTLGSAQMMLDRAVDYAKQRVQFNRVIASFQAVKHMCADMVTALEPCRSLVWYAAHAQDVQLADSHVAACHAKAHLAEVGREVAYTSTLVHGAIGFTDALGLHLGFKRIATNRQIMGTPEQCRREAMQAQLQHS